MIQNKAQKRRNMIIMKKKKKNPEHEQQGNRNVLNVLSLFAKLVYLSNFLNIPWHLWKKNQSFFCTANFNLLHQSIPLEKCKSCSIFHEFYRALICSFCFRIRKKIVKRKTSNIRTVFIHHAIQ